MLVKSVNVEIFNQKQIIKFIASSADKNYGLGFRAWNYAEMIIQFTLENENIFICEDTRIGATLTNYNFVRIDYRKCM